MRRSDLILYLGILILFLGLVSWFVSQDHQTQPIEPAELPPADGIPEIPELPESAEGIADGGEGDEGLLALALSQIEAMRREGDRLSDRVWKDGLTDNQRGWLTSIGDKFARLRDFTLSLQFLLILVFTALLVGLYHLVSSGKLQRMLRRSNGTAPGHR
jgi:hypothetical protein